MNTNKMIINFQGIEPPHEVNQIIIFDIFISPETILNYPVILPLSKNSLVRNSSGTFFSAGR